MLSNAYLLANFGFDTDTIENEPAKFVLLILLIQQITDAPESSVGTAPGGRKKEYSFAMYARFAETFGRC